MAETGAAADLAPPPLSGRARLRAILGGSAGNLVEWYDWFAYSAFTLYFADHFFPKGDPTAQLLQAAAIFAVGFLARPIGAWAMGYYADRFGRRAALVACVALMSLGSFAIAAIPSYTAIGVWAPALLMLARLVQGTPSTNGVAAELTSAEYRVALAVSDGATNREAAADLFLSVKTVDFHLQNIYRKLGLRSRTELAVRVRGEGAGAEQ